MAKEERFLFNHMVLLKKKKKKKTLAKLLGAFLNNMDLLGRIQPVLLTSKNMSACVILSNKYQDACEFT